jgi:hypothetical protein
MDFTIVLVAMFVSLAIMSIADAIESRGCDGEYEELEKRVARLEETVIISKVGCLKQNKNTLLSQEEIDEIVRRFRGGLESKESGEK